MRVRANHLGHRWRRTQRPRPLTRQWLISLSLLLLTTPLFGQSPAEPPASPSTRAAAESPVSAAARTRAESNSADTAAPGDDSETEVLRAVVRVSWRLIDRLADDRIRADVPFESPVMGGTMSGRVQSRADITIQMQEQPESAQFTIVAEGTARGHYAASRDRISLNGPLAIPFQATKQVAFDGRRFQAGATRVDANVEIDFNCIQLRRNGPFARIATRLITPAVYRERPNLEASAQPLAQQYLTGFVDEEMETLVAHLNEVSHIESSILRVYPQLKDWKVRLSSTPDYLEARYVPPDSAPLQLPVDPQRPTNAGLEIWIRTTAAEAKFLARVGGWDQSQQLLKNYFQEQDVGVEEMSSDAQVVAIDDWVLIALGQAISAG